MVVLIEEAKVVFKKVILKFAFVGIFIFELGFGFEMGGFLFGEHFGVLFIFFRFIFGLLPCLIFLFVLDVHELLHVAPFQVFVN